RVEEFIRQAEQYEMGGGAWDTVFKILNTVMRTHPMHTVRAAELLRWHKSGEYDAILAGNYRRRGQNDSDQPLKDDYADAADYYGQKTRETVDTFKDGLSRAKDAVNSAWRNR
ncbi:MAG: peptidase M48, partial [Gemmatimonadaceae bacterium]